MGEPSSNKKGGNILLKTDSEEVLWRKVEIDPVRQRPLNRQRNCMY